MIVPIAVATAVVGAVVVNEIRSGKRLHALRISGPAPTRMPRTWTTRGK